MLADVRRNIWKPPEPVAAAPAREDPSFHEFASEWIASREHELAPRTIEDNRLALTHHLLPFFARHRMSEITAREVDRYKAAKVREHEAAQIERPLSNRTINKTLIRLGQILDVAVLYELIEHNPVKTRVERLKEAEPRRARMTGDQAQALLRAAGRNRALLATAIMAGGLRASELTHMRWQDVDLSGGVLTVTTSKTVAGLREVILEPELVQLLREHKIASNWSQPGDFVFPGRFRDQPRERNSLRTRVLHGAVRSANEQLEQEGKPTIPPDITFHALRRTYAALRAELGEHPAITAAQMGHRDPRMTLRVYTDVTGARPKTRLAGLLGTAEWAQIASSRRIYNGKGRDRSAPGRLPRIRRSGSATRQPRPAMRPRCRLPTPETRLPVGRGPQRRRRHPCNARGYEGTHFQNCLVAGRQAPGRAPVSVAQHPEKRRFARGLSSPARPRRRGCSRGTSTSPGSRNRHKVLPGRARSPSGESPSCSRLCGTLARSSSGCRPGTTSQRYGYRILDRSYAMSTLATISPADKGGHMLPDADKGGFFNIRFESIGGLGAHLAGKILAEAGILRQGLNGSHFSSYGSEKKGTPVKSFVRFCPGDQEVRTSSPIENPQVVAVFHEALAQSIDVAAGLGPTGTVIVNTRKAPDEVRNTLGLRSGTVAVLDALGIAVEEKTRVNTAMLGAVARVCAFLDADAIKDTMCETFSAHYSHLIEANLRTFDRGYRELRSMTWPAAPGEPARPVQRAAPAFGYLDAPIGGVILDSGNSIVKNMSTSRQGFLPAWDPDTCIHCGICDIVCPDLCFAWSDDEDGEPAVRLLGIDYHYCKGCLKCIDACPTGSLTELREEEGWAEEHRVPLFPWLEDKRGTA